MPSINELKNQIEKMGKEKQGIIADQAIFYSECLKIGLNQGMGKDNEKEKTK